MSNELEDTKNTGNPSPSLVDSQSNLISLEQHFKLTSKIIDSWPSWKQGLVVDMSTSFATENKDIKK